MTSLLYIKAFHFPIPQNLFSSHLPRSRAIQFFFFSLPFTAVFLCASGLFFSFFLAPGDGTKGFVANPDTLMTGGTGGV